MNNSAVTLQLDKAKAFFADLLRRIETSPYFERAIVKYQNLDLRQQKTLRITALILTMAIPLSILVVPIVTAVSDRGVVKQTRSLVAEIQRFNEEQSVVHQPAPRPLGWQALAVTTPEESEASLTQYLGGIGVTGDLLELTRSGDSLRLMIKELSIKQAVAFVHQLDGWYPALHMLNLKLSVNATDKQLLTLEVALRHDAGGAQQLGRAPPPRASSGGGSYAPPPPSSSNSFGNAGAESAPPARSSTGAESSPSTSDDFGDLPPPPPFEEDL